MKELLVILFLFVSVTCSKAELYGTQFNAACDDDSVFLKSVIAYKKNVFIDLQKKALVTLVRDTINYKYVDKSHNIVISKIKFRSSLLKKAELVKLKFKSYSNLMQRCIFVLYIPNTHEVYIFHFEDLHIKKEEIFLCYNTRGKRFVYRLSAKKLFSLFSKT